MPDISRTSRSEVVTPSARHLITPRLLSSIGALALLIVGLALGRRGFTVVVAALSGLGAVDFVTRLDRTSPDDALQAGDTANDGRASPAALDPAPPDEEPVARPASRARAEVPVAIVAGAACAPSLLQLPSWTVAGPESLYLGMALAILVIAGWGIARTPATGLAAAIGRAALAVFVFGFGGAHLVLLRLSTPKGTDTGIRVAVVLIALVAFYEIAASIFERAEVRVSPAQNRMAPIVGGALCAVVGIVAGGLGAAQPPLDAGSGLLLGLCAAAGAGVGRALPVFMLSERREGGVEAAAVLGPLVLAAPVVYYVSQVIF